MPLNFGGRKRSGAFDTVWPPANVDVEDVDPELIRDEEGKKGLRDRNSPMCTLSQNGYGDTFTNEAGALASGALRQRSAPPTERSANGAVRKRSAPPPNSSQTHQRTLAGRPANVSRFLSDCVVGSERFAWRLLPNSHRLNSIPNEFQIKPTTQTAQLSL